MMIKPICLVLTLLLGSQAREFHNPVLDGGDFPDPGVIYHEGVYYAVTTTNNDQPEKYPIHTSTDLQNWEHIGYVFNRSNFPVWSRETFEFWAPEIHKIGDEFRIYYTSRITTADLLVIGVATSKNVAGPYTDIGEPLLVDQDMWEVDSTIINHNGTLMLCWVGASYIRTRNLTDDGLAFKDNNTILLFHQDLPWEGGGTEGPWYVFRNDYHYIFYSGNDFCTEEYALGVARSRSITGPYEKHLQPLLVSNDQFKGPGHGSIVRDVDGEGYVYVHHGWRAGKVCGDNWRIMFSTNMEWGDDDWPKNMTIT